MDRETGPGQGPSCGQRATGIPRHEIIMMKRLMIIIVTATRAYCVQHCVSI